METLLKHHADIVEILIGQGANINCLDFLATLLRLASDQPESVARNVRSLIQVDMMLFLLSLSSVLLIFWKIFKLTLVQRHCLVRRGTTFSCHTIRVLQVKDSCQNVTPL